MRNWPCSFPRTRRRPSCGRRGWGLRGPGYSPGRRAAVSRPSLSVTVGHGMSERRSWPRISLGAGERVRPNASIFCSSEGSTCARLASDVAQAESELARAARSRDEALRSCPNRPRELGRGPEVASPSAVNKSLRLARAAPAPASAQVLVRLERSIGVEPRRALVQVGLRLQRGLELCRALPELAAVLQRRSGSPPGSRAGRLPTQRRSGRFRANPRRPPGCHPRPAPLPSSELRRQAQPRRQNQCLAARQIEHQNSPPEKSVCLHQCGLDEQQPFNEQTIWKVRHES